jgi:cytochrome c peroxidase
VNGVISSNISKRLIQRYILLIILLLLSVIIIWQQSQTQQPSERVNETNTVTEEIVINEPIQPIPRKIGLNNQKVGLGNQLFHDVQLSHYNSISCATCHNLNRGGADGLSHAEAMNDAKAQVNTPTVFNSGFNFKLNWDGRAETLEDQIEQTIKNPKTFNSNWSEVIAKLKQSSEYVKAFNNLYPDNQITADNIKDAIATFERSLFTPNSRFDKFLRGDRSAISSEEKEGYHLFKTSGCISCHQGVIAGGNLFQKFGIMGDYFGDRGKITTADLGRFNVTKKQEDWYVFKVPSLRNVALTAPYFHDGNAQSLEEAIALMAKYQLGRNFTPEKVELITKFLQTLTGEYQGKPL